MQEDLNAVVDYDKKFNNAIVRHVLDLKNAGIFQNPNPLDLTFCNVKKFDLQNPIIGKLATKVKASKLTEDQLTKKILMQDQIGNIENRLEELRKPTNINDNSGDDTSAVGGSGGRGGDDGGTPPRPPGGDEFNELTRRFNKLCGNRPPLPPPRTLSRPRVTRPDVEPDLRDVLNNKLNRLRYGPIMPNQEEKICAKRLSERQREIAQILKGTVKSRKSDVGLFQPILPHNPPPTPNRGNHWPPSLVGSSDINFIKPQLPPKPQFSPKAKPQLPPKPIKDIFARPLTKIIYDEKNI